MAPFYLAGQLLKIPVWLTERLWLSLLVAVGFAGLVKLAEAVRIGTDRSRIVAGLAFALWPTFTIVIGSTSAGILPGLLAPLAVLPLVRVADTGPDAGGAGTGALVRAAARSGVVVLFMGGVNATSTLYPLILPALFILTQMHGRQRVKLAALWVGAVLVATAWWLVPLVLQAAYSFNFLPYVEQAATTTGTMSAAAFLRGSGNWTAYLNLGQPWLRAGWVMVAYPVAIMAAAIAAGSGAGRAGTQGPAGQQLAAAEPGHRSADRAGRLPGSGSAARSTILCRSCWTAWPRRCAASTRSSRSPPSSSPSASRTPSCSGPGALPSWPIRRPGRCGTSSRCPSSGSCCSAWRTRRYRVRY